MTESCVQSATDEKTLKRKSDSNEEDLKTISSYKKVDINFYDTSCEALAKSLLGKILVRRIDEWTVLRGRIVETECYLGAEDKASHSYNGRKTERNEPMFMKAGTAYVYMTYGMYFCFNISSKEPGAAVLLRALEPIDGVQYMFNKRGKRKKVLKMRDLCNGPSKLCISFNINKELCNKLDLNDNELLWIESEETNDNFDIITSSRIGIESAGEEWASKPLRFYILGNSAVSKRDKIVENIILNRLNTTE